MNAKLGFFTAALIVPAFLYGAAPAQAVDAAQQSFVYQQELLVGDKPGVGKMTDASLVDPWGFAFQPNGTFWIANRRTGVATLYNGEAPGVMPTLVIPNPAGGRAGPTGLVWNPSEGFVVPGTRLNARFIVATLQGTIAAWAPNLPVAPRRAVTAVDNSKSGAIYTGLAFGVTKTGAFLYAANVHAGRIDVFDAAFNPGKLPGKFLDPNIPAGFVPFNIQAVGGNMVVTYARQNAAKDFVVAGKGAGFVDIFDTSGNLVRRLAGRGALNAPWGAALAPAGFGGGSGRIIVGNFGDGHILAVDQKGGAVDPLLNSHHEPIVLPGLWSLGFGGGAGSDPRTLFFTSGILLQQDGVFGTLTAADPLAF